MEIDTVVITLSPNNAKSEGCTMSYNTLDDAFYSQLADQDLIAYLTSIRKLRIKVLLSP